MAVTIRFTNKSSSAIPACPIFLYLFFYDQLFLDIFLYIVQYEIVFFEVALQSGEMHLKTLSSSSKLGTTVLTLIFVSRWFALN